MFIVCIMVIDVLFKQIANQDNMHFEFSDK